MPPGSGPSSTQFRGVDAALERLNATIASFRLDKSQERRSNQASSTEASSEPRKSAETSYENKLGKIEHIRDYDSRRFSIFIGPSDSDRYERLYPQITNQKLRQPLLNLHQLLQWQRVWPYTIELQTDLIQAYLKLGYPDLAAGAAYKALLLLDAIQDDSDEFHDLAVSGLRECISFQPFEVREKMAMSVDDVDLVRRIRLIMSDPKAWDEVEVDLWITECYVPEVYGTLQRCLYSCGCYKSAFKYGAMGLRLMPTEGVMTAMQHVIMAAARKKLGVGKDDELSLEDLPDQGLVRREAYLWAQYDHETDLSINVDRFDPQNLATLNEEMAKVAPKLEVCAVELPSLANDGSATSKQLGVFAKEDIKPGEVILEEVSLLTANNRLQDALCDACSADLPTATSSSSTVVSCEDCDVVFCSEQCYVSAQENYHPAVCDKDVDSIARDVPPAQAADSLYLLLLLRSLALSETRDLNPLLNPEVKFIWGDYTNLDLNNSFRDPTQSFPCTLPFSFDSNIALPFTMLLKMDIDIFRAAPTYDVWIFNMLYAKFRGTASARLSGQGEGSGGRIRGPEVSAVHPNWCLANHSCDPSVQWEWGGKVRFWAREARKEWRKGNGETKGPERAGVMKGEEILNHYCDIDLPVKERREWAAGALGGDCRCERCVWEAGESD